MLERMLFASSGGSENWLAILYNSAWRGGYSGGAVGDANGEVYLNARIDQASFNAWNYTARLSSTGAIVWQRKFALNRSVGSNIAINSSTADVYCGPQNYVSGDRYLNIPIKYNSDGVLQWQRQWYNDGGIGDLQSGYISDICVDNQGSVYFGGQENTNLAIWSKFNSSGTVQLQRYLSSPQNEVVLGITTDSSRNVFIAGWCTASGSYDGLFAKWNSAGTLQWQRFLTRVAGSTEYAIDTICDSSGNIYVAINSSGNGMILMKFNTSATILWQRRLASATLADTSSGVTVDSSDNVYIVGNSTDASAGGLIIAKYNSSGTLQFQRRIYSTGYSVSGNRINIDGKGNMIIAGSTNARDPAKTEIFVAKLPGDGTKTGTYTLATRSFVYETSSLTSSDATFATSTPTLTSAAFGGTVTTPTFADTATTLTEMVTPL